MGEIRETSDVLTIRTKDLKRSVDKLKLEVRQATTVSVMTRVLQYLTTAPV